MKSTKKGIVEIDPQKAKEAKELTDRIINDLYEKYKDECDAIIGTIVKEKLVEQNRFDKNEDVSVVLEPDTALLKLVSVFHYLMSDEAKANGRTPQELEDLIRDFIPQTIDNLKTVSVKANTPKNYVMPNHKIVNALAKQKDLGFDEIAVTKVIPKAPEIKTKASLQFDDNVELPKNYTQYDRAVLNAICSLCEAGNTHFTPLMVYRVMTGQTKTTNVRPQSISAVTRSIEKQRKAIVQIDGTEELKKRKIDGAEKLVFDSNILPLDRVRAVINGNDVECYHLVKAPILYDYCKYTGQILTVPLKLLDTKSVRNSEDIIVIKEYMLRQIALIKNGYRNNSRMLYDTIFSECGIFFKENDRTTKKRYRDYIKKLLQDWVDMNHIKAFKEYTENQKSVGVEVTV